jgi:large subunit ribosomal protein L22
MGARKRTSAEQRKEEMKSIGIAKLNNVPTSPRKMRIVADLIRGKEVTQAMNILHYNAKQPAKRLEKLLKSAIVNWETKTGDKIDEGKVFVKTIMVDSARMLKRLRPAPQGRGYRIRKRSNHVTLVLDYIQSPEAEVEETTVKEETK